MRYFLFPILILFAGCFAPREEIISRAVDSVDEELTRLAKEMAKEMPKDRRVYVATFKSHGKLYYTQLGDYLARKFSQNLGCYLPKGTMVDRPKGEIAVEEERKYIVSGKDESTALRELLNHFRADYAIFGTYDLTEGVIDFIELKPVSTKGAEIYKTLPLRKVRVSQEFYNNYHHKEKQIIWRPQKTKELPFFIRETGKWNAIKKVSLVNQYGEPTAERATISVGTYYKVKVEIAPGCIPVYLYAFGWDDDNNIPSILYPVPQESHEPVTQTVITVPTKVSYRAEAPGGHNWLVVIAMKDRLNIQQSNAWYENPIGELPKFDQALKTLGEENWSSGRVEFWIRVEEMSR